jgi:hypothetical protein
MLLLLSAGGAAGELRPAAWNPLPAVYPDGLGASATAGSPDASAPPGAPPASSASTAATASTLRLQTDDSGGGAAASKPKSGKKALLYSLLLPGTGELYLGHSGRATGFFVAEGLIWTSFIYWTVAEDMRQDDYIEQAQLNAGVGVSSAADSYWSLVGQYISSSGDGPDTYEEQLRIDARNLYPDDPAAQDAYVNENLPQGDEAWSWTSLALQDNYVATRQSAQQADNNAEYSIAAAVLNRIISVIDVQLLRHKAAKEAKPAGQAASPYQLWAAAGPDGTKQLIIQRRF